MVEEEAVSADLETFLALKGIKCMPSDGYVREKNALVVKLSGELVNKMRTTMHAADRPSKMWPIVFRYIVDTSIMRATRALLK